MPAAPLNERQLEVLRWLASGCPERTWPNESHKHSARALQSRGLAHVARRQGVWIAEITDAGLHYVMHGDYPAGMKERAKSVRGIRGARTRHHKLDAGFGHSLIRDGYLLNSGLSPLPVFSVDGDTNPVADLRGFRRLPAGWGPTPGPTPSTRVASTPSSSRPCTASRPGSTP